MSTRTPSEAERAYEILDPLGRGGFGTVYRARRWSDGADVAIKILREEHLGSNESVARLEREAAVLASLAHPAIVRVHEVGRMTDGRPFLVMELLVGRDLGARVAERGRLTPSEALDILEPICAALEAAHARGVLHRDLKPANVFLDDRSVKPRGVLLDFGLAKLLDETGPGLTASRELVGTPSAMAPEQIRAEPLDPRTDVYGLGALAFFAIAGRMPFEDKPSLAVRELHLYARVPDASRVAPVPREVDAVISRAMAKRAADRFEGANAFFAALRSALGGRSAARNSALHVVAVHVAWSVPTEELATASDALLDDLDAVLTIAERILADAGARTVDRAGNALVAIVELPVGGNDERDARRTVIEMVKAAREAIDARPASDARVRVFVSMTAGDAIVEDGRLVGGSVADYAAWTAEQPEGVAIAAGVLGDE
ncbi:MAG: serine/threonine protein kinase [Polyangiaceae bacterium]|nr:serine/threonine protein kinase [Polyangiaceae bacterium]